VNSRANILGFDTYWTTALSLKGKTFDIYEASAQRALC